MEERENLSREGIEEVDDALDHGNNPEQVEEATPEMEEKELRKPEVMNFAPVGKREARPRGSVLLACTASSGGISEDMIVRYLPKLLKWLAATEQSERAQACRSARTQEPSIYYGSILCRS